MGLKKTQFYAFHAAQGHLVDFAGFAMPLYYEGITVEHLAVRDHVGVFDVTHMGRALVSGREAGRFLDYVTTRKPSALRPLRGHYTVMCNDRGGIVDDVTVFRLADDQFFVVYNAGNRDKDYQWLVTHGGDYHIQIEDRSDQIPMLALQGPQAAGTLQRLTSTDIQSLKRYRLNWLEVASHRMLVTRSGYTGEDGFELYLWDAPLAEPERALTVWNRVLKAGEDFGIKPCGLGARDTLRLEAGMCLYGNDLDEATTPFEAGLEFVVNLEAGDFIGRAALETQRRSGVAKQRIGVKMIERGIPRPGCEVYKDEKRVGVLTSGTYSPLLKCGIAMAYVSPAVTHIGEVVKVKIRNRVFTAEVVEMPFYNAAEYGWRRRGGESP
jgi:aminomethyltransferase